MIIVITIMVMIKKTNDDSNSNIQIYPAAITMITKNDKIIVVMII